VLWEFWNEQYLGSRQGSFRALVPPRSVRVYRLAKARPHPWILGTDMHVTQGQVELAEVRWDEATRTLSGTATRPAGNCGTLFVSAPKGLAVVNPQGYHIARDAHDDSLVISRQFEFTGEPVAFALNFTEIAEPHAK
jgi:hypothetical protein